MNISKKLSIFSRVVIKQAKMEEDGFASKKKRNVIYI